MISEVRVDFCVMAPKEVPQIGKRKQLLVNGKKEWMRVKKVEVKASKGFDEDGQLIVEFMGTAVFTKTLWD